MSPPSTLTDSTGRVVQLGVLIGQGGEGAVYEVANDSNAVAKIYQERPSAERSEKLRVMTAMRTDALTALTAWPISLLLNRQTPVGFIMPKMGGRTDVHNLYSPKSRRSQFHRADWRFLIRAATNIARAFSAVHGAGAIIGDVNHSSIFVGQDATVRLIDCDSFQILVGGKRYLCEVGVETFTPPELQGRSFKGVVRNENTDNFGLAVMTFLILFMGRHPFAGRFLGRGDMPIARAIQENRFAYGARRSLFQMEKPPGVPDLAIVGSEVSQLFETAFARDRMLAGRPTPKQWIAALERLEKSLKQCPANAAHWHLPTQACPWCAMEGATGVTLFPLMTQVSGGTAFDFERLWREVENIPHPGPAPELSQLALEPSPQARDLAASKRQARMVAVAVSITLLALGVFGPLRAPWAAILFFGGIAAFFAILSLMDKRSEIRAFKMTLDGSSSRWHEAQREWANRAGPESFNAKRKELVNLRQEWLALPARRLRKLDDLKRNHRHLQLEMFLDGHEIRKYKIEGIGRGRTDTLESYGIVTAADVTPAALAAVPGFGPKLEGTLLSWRSALERQFVFNPNQPIDPSQVAAVEQSILSEKKALEGQLIAAIAALKQTHGQIMAARTHLLPQVQAAFNDFRQAQVDKDALNAL
jgi:DNA-binding helix-hairpin-helix protein with protein kinase domain